MCSSPRLIVGMCATVHEWGLTTDIYLFSMFLFFNKFNSFFGGKNIWMSDNPDLEPWVVYEIL